MNEEHLHKAERVAYLIAGFIRQELSQSESDELDEWIAESDQNMLLFEELTDEKNLDKAMAYFKGLDTTKAWTAISHLIDSTKRKTSPIRRKFFLYAAAAAVILFFGATFIWKQVIPEKPDTPAPAITVAHDLEPGTNKAVLQTSDGRQINLAFSSDTSVQVATGNYARNVENVLAYSASNNPGSNPVYNVLKTPAGGQYQLVLEDGTKVWLNAMSSLRYPVSFVSDDRRVELEGEAYFEVAHDASRPFIVQSGTQSVQVLGTHFNIESYPDADVKKVTLLEGSVKVATAHQTLVLSPGQQLLTEKNGKEKLLKDVNIDQAIAWKNGVFSFTRDSIETVMAQMARWYNVNIEYRGHIDQVFTGKIYRNSNASQVLRMLELAGGVHFKIEGNKIIVSP